MARIVYYADVCMGEMGTCNIYVTVNNPGKYQSDQVPIRFRIVRFGTPVTKTRESNQVLDLNYNFPSTWRD